MDRRTDKLKTFLYSLGLVWLFGSIMENLDDDAAAVVGWTILIITLAVTLAVFFGLLCVLDLIF